MREVLLNQTTYVPVASVNLTTGLTTLPVTMFVDGRPPVSTPTPTVTEVSGGYYYLTIQPNQSGRWDIFYDGKLVYSFLVVTKLTSEFMSRIEDALLGSWSWDKQTGVLTLYTQTGDPLGTYSMVDSQSTSSRQLD